MARPEKVAAVQEVVDKIGRAKALVLTDYRGLNVKSMTELRRTLTQAGVEYKVVKNTLTLRAAKESGIEGLDSILTGPTAIAFGYEDEVVAAKLLAEFAKTHKQLELKAGVLEGKVLSAQDVKALADLPSKEVLLAKLLGSMQSPISGFVNVLQGNIRNLVYALEAVRKLKEEQAGA